MGDDEISNEKTKDKLAQIERIEELYSLADFIAGAHSAGAAQSVQVIKMAKKRLKTLISGQSQDTAIPVSHSKHGWVSRVLEDLCRYAAANGLQLLENDLFRTLVRFEKLLNTRH